MGKRHKITILLPVEKLTLEQAAYAAREAGLTYGQWVAIHEPPKPMERFPKTRKTPKDSPYTEHEMPE